MQLSNAFSILIYYIAHVCNIFVCHNFLFGYSNLHQLLLWRSFLFYFFHLHLFTPFKCKISHKLVSIFLFTRLRLERVLAALWIFMIFEWQAVFFEVFRCPICDIHLPFTVRWPYLTRNSPLKWQMLVKKNERYFNQCCYTIVLIQ